VSGGPSGFVLQSAGCWASSGRRVRRATTLRPSARPYLYLRLVAEDQEPCPRRGAFLAKPTTILVLPRGFDRFSRRIPLPGRPVLASAGPHREPVPHARIAAQPPARRRPIAVGPRRAFPGTRAGRRPAPRRGLRLPPSRLHLGSIPPGRRRSHHGHDGRRPAFPAAPPPLFLRPELLGRARDSRSRVRAGARLDEGLGLLGLAHPPDRMHLCRRLRLGPFPPHHALLRSGRRRGFAALPSLGPLRLARLLRPPASCRRHDDDGRAPRPRLLAHPRRMGTRPPRSFPTALPHRRPRGPGLVALSACRRLLPRDSDDRSALFELLRGPLPRSCASARC
jgi:hypothetical protein